MKINFSEMFSEFVAANQKEWAHDRRETVGASEVFACIRQIWFRKRAHEFMTRHQIGVSVVENGVDNVDGEEIPHYDEIPVFEVQPMYPIDEGSDDENWGATKRGDLLETNFVVPTIRDHLPKGKLVWGGTEQKTLFHNHNSATPDGLIIGLDRDALVDYGIPDIKTNSIIIEIKTIDPRVRLDEEKAIHSGQAKTQLGIIREKTIYKPEFAVILYVDASFLDKIKVFVVEYSDEAWEAAQERADRVFTTEDPAELPAEGKITGECEHCQHKRSCAFVSTGMIPPDESKLAAKNEEALLMFDDLVANHKEADEALEEAKKNMETAKQNIRDALVDLGTRKIGGRKAKRKWSVSWKAQQGQNRLDTKLLTQALGDLEPYKSQGNPFDILRITIDDDDNLAAEKA